MKSNRQRVYYFGVFVEYKYARIIEHLPIEYIPTNFIGIVKGLLFKERRADRPIVHLRYIQFRGYVTTIALYGVLILICKLRGARIVWSCHNIYEHGIASRAYGNFLRSMLCRACTRVIVFHPSLQKYLGRCADKVVVANFGGFKGFITDPDLDKHPSFLTDYRSWLDRLGRQSADIVFVGEYKARKNIELLVEFAHCNPGVNALIVAHRTPSITNCPDNLLLHNETRIFGELDEVLRGKDVIGFVAHDNYSVPTGIHLYADYGVPILGVDMEPVSCFIKNYSCGAVFSDLAGLKKAYVEVRAQRAKYSRGMTELAARNTWEKSAKSHRRAFELSPEMQS